MFWFFFKLFFLKLLFFRNCLTRRSVQHDTNIISYRERYIYERFIMNIDSVVSNNVTQFNQGSNLALALRPFLVVKMSGKLLMLAGKL